MPEVTGVKLAKSLVELAKKSPWSAELQRLADEAWDVAEALSEAAGFAYIDRHSVRGNPEQDHTFMVSQVLKAYAARRGPFYDSRTE